MQFPANPKIGDSWTNPADGVEWFVIRISPSRVWRTKLAGTAPGNIAGPSDSHMTVVQGSAPGQIYICYDDAPTSWGDATKPGDGAGAPGPFKVNISGAFVDINSLPDLPSRSSVGYIVGEPVVGGTLTVQGTDADVPGTVQWLANGQPIASATGDSYTVDPTDSGEDIAAEVTFQKNGVSLTGVTGNVRAYDVPTPVAIASTLPDVNETQSASPILIDGAAGFSGNVGRYKLAGAPWAGINALTGEISIERAAAQGQTTLTITAEGVDGTAQSQTFDVTIGAVAPTRPTFDVPFDPVDAKVGGATIVIDARNNFGGGAVETWTVSPDNVGVSIDGDGLITVDTSAAIAQQDISVQADNAAGSATGILSVHVAVPLPDAPTEGAPFVAVTATVGDTIPTIDAKLHFGGGTVETWTVQPGNVGVSISDQGIISISSANPIPSQNVIVTAANRGGSATNALSVRVQGLATQAPVINNPGTITGETNADVLNIAGLDYEPADADVTYTWVRDDTDLIPAPYPTFLAWKNNVGARMKCRIDVTSNGQTETKETNEITLKEYEYDGVGWDPDTMDSAMSLSNGGKTIKSSGIARVARANKYLMHEPAYLEIEVGAGATVFCGAGITYEQARPQPSLTSTNEDMTYFMGQGTVYAPSGQSSNGGTVDVGGDVIGIAFDPTSHRMWWRWQSGGGWKPSGDPEAGTGGAVTPDYEPLVPFIAPRMNNGAGFTLRSKYSEFTMALPAGSRFKSYAAAEALFEPFQTVRSGDSVVDAYGTNSHDNWQNYPPGANAQPTIYAKNLHEPLIEELKIRHVRTAVGSSNNAYGSVKRLGNKGVKFLVHIVDKVGTKNVFPFPSYNHNATKSKIDGFLAAGLAPFIIGGEGPNEANDGATTDWHIRSRNEQQSMYAYLKGSTATSAWLVPSISTWRRSTAADQMLGDQASMADAANGHLYPQGWAVPSVMSIMTHATNAAAANIRNNVSLERIIAAKRAAVGGKDIIVTEFGVRIGNDMFTVPEEISGEYVLRMFFHFLILGAMRCYQYNIADDITTKNWYGMCEQNFTNQTIGRRRALFNVVKSFIAYFDNPNQGYQPTAKPRFHLSGDTSKMQFLPVQLDSNKYGLVIFNDKCRWDGSNILNVPDTPIKVGCWRPIVSAREVSLTPTFAAKAIPANAQDLTFNVSTNPRVVELTLG